MLTMRDLIPWTRGREVGRDRDSYVHPLDPFQREFDRLFDDMWETFDLPLTGRFRPSGDRVAPRIDLTEDDAAVHVSAELPGMAEDDVEVVLGDGSLTIKGEKTAEREETETGYTYSERSFGRFHRTIPLGVEVMSDKVEATFTNGVLEVTLPKAPEVEAKTRKIAVKAGTRKAKAKAKAVEHDKAA